MAATGTLDQSQTVSSLSIAIGNSSTFKWFAQQVTIAEAGFLSDITLQLFKNGSPTDDVSVMIYSDDGADAPDSLISDTQVINSADLTTTPTDYVFTFDTKPEIAASDKVWIVWNRVSIDGTNRPFFRASGGGDYGGGVLNFSSNGTSWAVYGASYDAYFLQYYVTSLGGGADAGVMVGFNF